MKEHMHLGEFPFTGPLEPADASAVVLTSEDGRYVMQRRDEAPGIFYPGHLGLFGGACESGEDFEQTAERELKEELSLSLSGRLDFFSRTTIGFEPFGYSHVDRVFFTATISKREISDICLGEGQGVELVDAARLLTLERIVPYDAFAIWLHCNANNRLDTI